MTTESIINGILSWFVYWISLPVWLAMSFWRGKKFRNFVFTVVIISWLIIRIVGATLFWGAVSLIGRYAIMLPFMALQFVAMFWFLSRTKVIESVPGEKGAISFDDYFGNEYLVDLVRNWVKLLTDRTKLDNMGGRAISGILLEGPPGTGKTMLAQALATDGDAAFIGMSGSDFTSMFFGIGVLKVRGMFGKARLWAKEYGSCILFIDEIDAIAASRGGVSGDPTQGPVQGGLAGGMFGGMGAMGVLSRLLVEMDGITEIPLRDRIQNTVRGWIGVPAIDPGIVLIMGSTNRVQVLDPAIVRPGRFDRTIKVGLPDKGSRRLMFEGYLKKVKHRKIDVDVLVRVTPGVSPALIASAVTKDAARLAIFDKRSSISQNDILMALQELAVGVPQPISEFDPEQRLVVAIHEAGHACAVYHLMREHAVIGWVSIVRRGGAMGYVSRLETEDRYMVPLARLRNGIIVSLAGHEAVKLVTGEPWTGASSDLNNVRAMIAGLIAHLEFGSLQTKMDVFETVKPKEMDKYMKQNMETTRDFLKEHRKELDALTDALLEKSELEGDEAVAIIEDAILDEANASQ